MLYFTWRFNERFSFQFLEMNPNLLDIHVVDGKCDSIRFRGFSQYLHKFRHLFELRILANFRVIRNYLLKNFYSYKIA